MEKLRLLLNSLPSQEQDAYAKASGTTVAYLRKAISTKAEFKAGLCIALVREAQRIGKDLTHEDLIPAADWESVRHHGLVEQQ